MDLAKGGLNLFWSHATCCLLDAKDDTRKEVVVQHFTGIAINVSVAVLPIICQLSLIQ